MSKRISFLDCPHDHVLPKSEVCLDCGYNIHTTMAEYKKSLEEELKVDDIRKLERRVGIKNYHGNIDPVTGEWDGDPPDSGMW